MASIVGDYKFQFDIYKEWLIKMEDTEMPQKFWMVWRNGSPTTQYRHTSLSNARAEAKRIAHKEPDEKIYVLEAVEYFTYEAVQNVKL